jgi:hypothetical protein
LSDARTHSSSADNGYTTNLHNKGEQLLLHQMKGKSYINIDVV